MDDEISTRSDPENWALWQPSSLLAVGLYKLALPQIATIRPTPFFIYMYISLFCYIRFPGRIYSHLCIFAACLTLALLLYHIVVLGLDHTTKRYFCALVWGHTGSDCGLCYIGAKLDHKVFHSLILKENVVLYQCDNYMWYKNRIIKPG